MRKLHLLSIILFCFVNVLPNINAQQHPSDPMEEYLFPPDLIMKHQKAIGLSDSQKKFILDNTQNSQKIFTAAQWKLQEEMELLLDEMSKSKINEKKALQQLEKLLSWENDIKKAQLQLMIKIKNKLTPKQQEMLQQIRKGQN